MSNELRKNAQELLQFFKTADTEAINASKNNTRSDNTWGKMIQQLVNNACKTISLADPEALSEDYERCNIVDKSTSKTIGHLFMISLHFRDMFYGPRCTIWIADTEDFQLQPVVCL